MRIALHLLTIDQEMGFSMCRRLAEEGILCGVSTGVNVADAIEPANKMMPGKEVVGLACNGGLKYLGRHIYA